MAAYACPSRLKSSLNRPAPVSRRTSSLRGNACPIAPAATRSGPLRSFTTDLPSLGAEVLAEKIDRQGERLVRLRFTVCLAAVARKSMVRARVLVDRHQRIRRKPAFEQLVHLRLNPPIFQGHMQHKRPVQVLRLADVVLYIRTVIGHGAVDVAAAAQEIAELAARAIAHRADLAVAFLHAAEEFRRVLHVAHAEVVVEVVIEIEGLFHVARIFVVELYAWLLAPEEVGHQAHEPRLGEFPRMAAHGVVHTPDFHDGDDRARRRCVRERNVRAHFAVPNADADIAGAHQFSFRSERALSAKIRSFSAFGIARLFTALMVSRMSMRPCSASKGASVANTQWPVVKKSCPQRVAEAEPLSEVSA